VASLVPHLQAQVEEEVASLVPHLQAPVEEEEVASLVLHLQAPAVVEASLVPHLQAQVEEEVASLAQPIKVLVVELAFLVPRPRVEEHLPLDRLVCLEVLQPRALHSRQPVVASSALASPHSLSPRQVVGRVAFSGNQLLLLEVLLVSLRHQAVRISSEELRHRLEQLKVVSELRLPLLLHRVELLAVPLDPCQDRGALELAVPSELLLRPAVEATFLHSSKDKAHHLEEGLSGQREDLAE